LINALKKILNVSKVGETLLTLASIKWLRVWTTNYDDAIEQSLKQNAVNFYSLTTASDVRNAQGNRFVVVHINGSISSLKQSITPDFILTSQSYATQAFVNTEWATIFRNDFQQSKAIIVVGYSLADIDISRLVFNPEIFFRKIHFVDQKDLDPVLKSKLSKFGTVHEIGLSRFKEILLMEKSNWVPPAYTEEYQSWQRIFIEDDSREVTDNDFYDLILKGVAKDGLLLSQFESSYETTYTVVRNFEERCINFFGQQSAVATLVGSFANGKSISIRSIALKLVAKGREVFTLDHPYESAYSELQRLCRRDHDFVLVIENYTRNIDLVECFCRYARPDCGLLLSERTEVHELNSAALIDRTNSRDLSIYELDLLENDEIARFSRLLDLRGLWSERAGLNEIQKISFLKEDCGRQLHAILIEVAKSPEIKMRLAKIVLNFESARGGYES
jgi:hypothetical protein